MLTKADDYPIHQTPEPIAYSGTDRNFYDRYFFNGYQRQGDLFFAAALGVYPHLNVMDAAFSFILDGKQHNTFGSKTLHMERLDTRVGNIEIEVVKPLEELKIRVADRTSKLSAELTFQARFPAIEEPRFIRRTGSMTSMDYTRLTQNGCYEGWIEFDGQRFDVARQDWWGTRDRSWGIRSIGMGDPQPNPYATAPQFFWLWSPLNFEDFATFYHLNASATGESWNTSGRIVTTEQSRKLVQVDSKLTFQPGTRHAAHALITLGSTTDNPTTIELESTGTFYMKGIGYGHPEWSHGHYHGELETGFETYDLATMSAADPSHFHIQAICNAECRSPDGSVHQGKGILEQLVIGPYEPYGFSELMDLAE
ncbi:MAG: hypothetical protein ACC642_02730 [Pseudomonadales bacterium]